MKRTSVSLIAATLALATTPLLFSAPAHAESLRVKVKQEQTMNLPKRGMSMADVKRVYGEPVKVLPTRGGSSKYQPPIHRWEYSNYIVYFEYKHVIHSVASTPTPQAP